MLCFTFVYYFLSTVAHFAGKIDAEFLAQLR